jgi:hypothetical protein
MTMKSLPRRLPSAFAVSLSIRLAQTFSFRWAAAFSEVTAASEAELFFGSLLLSAGLTAAGLAVSDDCATHIELGTRNTMMTRYFLGSMQLNMHTLLLHRPVRSNPVRNRLLYAIPANQLGDCEPIYCRQRKSERLYRG